MSMMRLYSGKTFLRIVVGFDELVLTLADTVSRGGNLLLNIGPAPDGTIPAIMEERLAQIGEWLQVNGEAIYGTRPWNRAAQWSPGERPSIPYGQQWRYKYDVKELVDVPAPGNAVVEAFFTSKGDTLYAIVPHWPAKRLVIRDLHTAGNTTVTMLGMKDRLRWTSKAGNLSIDVPIVSPEAAPCQYAYVIKITGVRQ